MALTYKKWVHQLVLNLITHMNFQDWTITLEFSDDPMLCDDPTVAAHVEAFSEYFKAKITIAASIEKAYHEGDIDLLLEIIVHEMCHLYSTAMSDFVEPYVSRANESFYTFILEQQTQRLTKLVLKTLPKSAIPPRKNGVVNNTTSKNRKLRPADDEAGPSHVLKST